YSAFLGPIFTVLIVDYFILKKQNLEIDELYNENGKFKGVNKYAVISIIVGAAFAFLNVQISWFLSIIPTGITYYILMKKSRSNT
ncbi:MAG: cytosine permease, partial [Clostridium butyricum]